MSATPRYSSTFIGEAFNHSAKRVFSSAARPSRFAMNQSAACSAMRVRIRSSLAFIGSSQPRHAPSAVSQRAAQVLFDHVGRNFELLGDLLVAESLPVLQCDGGLTLGRQLLEYLPQALHPGFGV